ncbi:acyl-CoA N-acyltransferase [Astrocystis sublimbata]|nr:acyl-CoA N-acyltransferase [Astrocystis sublimbata]
MPLVVLPAQICDIEAVYDVYFKAFEHQPVLRFLFPRGVDRKAHTEQVTHMWSADPNGYPIKCVDTDTGAIVGMACWDIFWKPGDVNAWQHPGGAVWLDGEDRETADKILVPIWDVHKELFGYHKHIYLPTIAVHPDYQRRGAGRMLMQWGVEVAEQLGLPIYLESTGPGNSLYRAMGFEQLTHVQIIHKAVDTGEMNDTEIPLMVRMPKTAKAMPFKEWAEKGYPKMYD